MPPAVGAILIFMAGFAALISLATDSIPLEWPFGPLRRANHPTAFRRFLIGCGVVGTVGALLLAHSVL